MDFEADAIGDKRSLAPMVGFAVRAVLLVAHLVIGHPRRVPAHAVRVDVAGLVAEDESLVLVGYLQYIGHLAGTFQREPPARSRYRLRSVDSHHLMYCVKAMRA